MTAGPGEPTNPAGITEAELAVTSGGDENLATERGASPSGASGEAVLERGTLVGRYVVVGKLGAGGMGVVYLAYDPELDRKVALKLLLSDASGSVGGSEGRTRLLREAQALAKLSHPNVVAIHDVGTVGERVWLAMEFVEGLTLKAWAKEKRRSWREVLEVMTPAGRGLAAAHAAGLLHRDFKPDNVMVGSDGRVRVMDFGLARTRGSSSIDSEVAGDIPSAAASLRATMEDEVTRVGAMLGTPAYMAPEQLRGRAVTAAADQFAYCVTLWEQLWGERPFVGATLVELAASVFKGKLRPPPKGHVVPGWVQQACRRGLDMETGKRFVSMEALLADLSRGQTRARRRKAFAGVVALALLAAGGEGFRRHDEATRVAACEAEGASITESWNDATRQQLREGLLATGVSYAETTAQRVIPHFDAQVHAWSTATTESCLDAEVRDVWDADLLERSRSCLDDRRMELTMLADELSRADATALQKAVAAAAGLSSVDACRDRHVLAVLPPAPAESRDELREVRALLARAGALASAGHYASALEQARAGLTQAEAVGWTPLTAAARVRTGVVLDMSGDYDAAAEALADGYFEAAQVSATEVAAQAATQAVYTIGHRMARHDEGLFWGRLAEVELGRLRTGEDDLRRAGLSNNLASVHYASGAYEEAKALHESALAIFERTLGPDHPRVAQSLNNLAAIEYSVGALAEAKALFERAISIRESALGPDHPDLAQSLGNLASVQQDAGAYEEAKALSERALAIWEQTLGPEHPDLAGSLTNFAGLHQATGAYAEAKALNERALAIWEKTLDPDHPDLAYALIGLAEIALAERHPVGAIEPAERALRIREAAAAPVELLAEIRFVLAQALWESGQERARAFSLARQASEDYAAAGEGEVEGRAKVEAWLMEHGGRKR